ncbi:MAG: zinc ribbon domain-containing protein [Oscillospiraceae bacterium]|nr:zinc ribbon domain-containing protein [Oscillospiraceae bacterium]
MTTETSICQSCAMPMVEPKDFGTQADGGLSEDYCVHCWQGGRFTGDSTLEQAVEANIPWWRDGCKNDDEARAKIMEVFPNLKRWKK